MLVMYPSPNDIISIAALVHDHMSRLMKSLSQQQRKDIGSWSKATNDAAHLDELTSK